MDVPVFVRQSAVATGTTSPLAVTITAAANGNTLIAFISNNRGASTGRTISSITATNTTGWTELGAVSYGNSRVAIWYGHATGTTGTSVSIAFSGTVASGCTAYVEEWSGILTSLTIAGATATTNTNTGTTASMTSFTPLQKDSWAGACVGAQSGTAPSASPGAPWANALTGGANTSNIGGVTQQLNSVSAQSGSWTIANIIWGTVVGELRSQTLTLSVNDSITVTESVTVAPQTSISVNDTTSATTESLNIVKVNVVSVNDSSSTTESVPIVSVGQISVNDTSTVVDKPVYPIHDDVTVTESVSLSVVSPGGTDTFSVNDSVTVAESVTLSLVTNVNINDAIATGNFYPTGANFGTQAGTLWEAQSFIAPFAYSIGGVVLDLAKTGTVGTVTVSLRAADSSGLPTGSDLTSGSFDGDAILTGSDQPITIGFSPAVSLSSGGSYSIIVRAPSAGGGDACKWFAVLGTFTSSKSAQFSVDSGANWSASTGTQFSLQTLASDDVTIVEVSGVSVNDSSTVTESVTLAVITNISLSDASTVTEDVTINIVSVGTLSVSVNDTATVTESVVLTVITQASVSDASTVMESVVEAVQTSLSVSDSATTTESVSIVSIDLPSVFDSSTVTENITEQIVTQLSVFDSATATENVSLGIVSPGTVSVVDSATVSENIDIRIGSITLLVFDGSTVTESVSMFKYTPGSGVAVEDRVNLGFRQGTSEADVLGGGFG